MNPWTAKAYVWREGPGDWMIKVVDSHGTIVNVDDSGSWAAVMRGACQRVNSVRCVEGMGHTLRAWSEIEEEVEE